MRGSKGRSELRVASTVMAPATSTITPIEANLGAPWIPVDDIGAFAAELFRVEESTIRIAHLPKGAENFTTIELKTNFLGTARGGTIACVATPAHLGNTTQVWDALVSDRASGRKIALFRCTQLVIWPRKP